MAKKLRQLAPGLADVTPTPDYCEAIFWEQRCEASSHWDPIYGSKCGRYCIHGVTQTQGNLREPLPKHAIIEVWGGGGYGGGGCCCTQGPPASGGRYTRACVDIQPGEIFCYALAHGGCCVSRREGYHGCWTALETTYSGKGVHGDDWKKNMGGICSCGGYCGVSQCFWDYCCYDRTGEGGPSRLRKVENDSDSSPGRQHTVYKYGCHYNPAFFAFGGEAFDNMSGNYRRPHERGKWTEWIGDNKNCVPFGRCLCNQGTANVNFRCGEIHGERCAAWGTCTRTWHSTQKDGHTQPSGDPGAALGYTATECYLGCAGWHCGNKPYSSVACPRTGTAFFNHTQINSSLARGGYEYSQWFLCHNGSNNQACWANIRTAGFGSQGGKHCQANGICCGGWAGHGLIIFRYK